MGVQKAWAEWIKKRGYLTAVCALTLALATQLLPISVSVAYARTEKNAGVSDWGLSFRQKGEQPTGNLSAAELKQYNAYYIGKLEQKCIYLTFDAGYENGNTAKILDVLKQHQVPAAFFLVEHYMNTNPDLIKRMANEGHIVGNHTKSHPNMGKIATFESLQAELLPVEQKYKEITGKDMKKFYRPPQGKFYRNNLAHAKELGYQTVFWSLAYVDWLEKKQPDPQAAIQKLDSRIHSGAVVLLHSTSQTNAQILEQLITRWKAQGYTFQSLDHLIQ